MQSFGLFQISYVNVLHWNVTLGWDKIPAINFYSQPRDKQIYFPPSRGMGVGGGGEGGGERVRVRQTSTTPGLNKAQTMGANASSFIPLTMFCSLNLFY